MTQRPPAPPPTPPEPAEKDIRSYLRQGPFFDSADVSETHFALPALPRPGDAPLEPWGVDWYGPWEDAFDGSGAATRLHAVALDRAGVPVRLVPSGLVGVGGDGEGAVRTDAQIDPGVMAEVDPLRHTRFEKSAAIISHLVPSIDRLRATLYPSQSHIWDPEGAERIQDKRILMSVWERDRCPPGYGPLLARFGQHWVPCQRNKRLLVAAGVPEERVRVIPHPLPTYSPLPAIGRAKKAPKPGEPYRFYSIGKWEPRKNQHGLLGAFLMAFLPGDLVTLAMKTSKYGRYTGYPSSPTESVQQHLARPEVRERGWTSATFARHVRLVVDKVAQVELWSWHQAGHCYVSASHGEAFDMPAFDAALAGSRLIHVGFGGSEDWAPPGSLRAWSEVHDGLEPCHSIYRWGSAFWAKVSEEQMSMALSKACADRRLGQAFDASPYAPSAVGALMRAGIEALWADGDTHPVWRL